MSESGESQS